MDGRLVSTKRRPFYFSDVSLFHFCEPLSEAPISGQTRNFTSKFEYSPKDLRATEMTAANGAFWHLLWWSDLVGVNHVTFGERRAVAMTSDFAR